MMKDLIKMVYTLMLVCMLSALVIASVNELTKDRIAEEEHRVELEAISSSGTDIRIKGGRRKTIIDCKG